MVVAVNINLAKKLSSLLISNCFPFSHFVALELTKTTTATKKYYNRVKRGNDGAHQDDADNSGT